MNDLDGLPPTLTREAETVSDVWLVFLVGAIFVLALVTALVLYVSIRFRRRSEALPPQKHYNIPVEVFYTAVPLLVVVGLFWITIASLSSITDEVDDPDIVVDVIAYQWQWEFVYPDEGIVVRADAQTDPELVLPADSTVRFRMVSRDVIHSFWIPGFLFKRDIFPDRTTTFDVELLDETGVWRDGACAEFCGFYHEEMGFSLRVVTPADFESWVASGGAPFEPGAGADADAGADAS